MSASLKLDSNITFHVRDLQTSECPFGEDTSGSESVCTFSCRCVGRVYRNRIQDSEPLISPETCLMNVISVWNHWWIRLPLWSLCWNDMDIRTRQSKRSGSGMISTIVKEPQASSKSSNSMRVPVFCSFRSLWLVDSVDQSRYFQNGVYQIVDTCSCKFLFRR